jgi:DNA gyrase/topoisomerase IV subunit A
MVHGSWDMAVYDTLARIVMAQDCSTLYQLVMNGNGKFGSIDNDTGGTQQYLASRCHAICDIPNVD